MLGLPRVPPCRFNGGDGAIRTIEGLAMLSSAYCGPCHWEATEAIGPRLEWHLRDTSLQRRLAFCLLFSE
jgi:hypothetical protein